jgi:hypothetical protein
MDNAPCATLTAHEVGADVVTLATLDAATPSMKRTRVKGRCGRPSLRSSILALLVMGAACDDDAALEPSVWTVYLSPAAPSAVDWTADDLVAYLGQMGLTASKSATRDPVSCDARSGRVVLAGDGLEGVALNPTSTNPQTYRIDESRCGPGRLVVLSGGGLLGRQYAAYEWLHALGVRFFHPEQTFVPESPRWPEQPTTIQHTPPFRYRSVSLHLSHPIELGDAFRAGKPETFDEAVRYIDWQIHNRASNGSSGIGQGPQRARGHERGFPRSVGFSLHGSQQGSESVLDPDDPRSEQEQLAAAIAQQMGDDPEQYPDFFGFTFDQTEFTEVRDVDVVRQMTFIAEHMAENYPNVRLMTINHGSGGDPTETYGIRYYDLPKLAPPNLGVSVHTLMFYDLFRPAPVYGHESFRFMYDFMVEQYRTRRLWYFPEAAWWLTFDIAVPLYLPITIEARSRDIDAIAFMLDGLLDGHRVFGTGHEWGYWQNEYCSLRMAADLDYHWRDCLDDIANPMGEVAAPVVAQVLQEIVALQERDIIYGDLLPYLVGTDPETETGAAIGVEVHPLPPAPTEILSWERGQLEDWLRRIRPALDRMDADYAERLERLRAVAESVQTRARPFFDEISDGIEITGLRARHARQVYGALVLLRQSQIRFDPGLRSEAEAWLAQAEATTEDALAVIARREHGYRYRPLARAIAGGPEGTEDDNWTVYRYRYLNRTHHGYYYTRIDRLAREAFAGGETALKVQDALIGPSETLALQLLDQSASRVLIDYGDGEAAEMEGDSARHSYMQPGVYQLEVTYSVPDEAQQRYRADVAQLEREYRTTGRGEIVEPAGARLIEPLLPSLVFGPVDSARLALGFATSDAATVEPALWSVAPSAPETDTLFRSAPVQLVVPVLNPSTGAVMTSLLLERGVISLTDSDGPARLTGQLATSGVVDALVALGGFDVAGARRLVAATLGFSPETMPATVPFAAEYGELSTDPPSRR